MLIKKQKDRKCEINENLWICLRKMSAKSEKCAKSIKKWIFKKKFTKIL